MESHIYTVFGSLDHVSDQGVAITCLWHAFGGRFTCDVPRSEELCIVLVVLASGDAHLAITVLCGSVFTFTDFFSAQ